MTESIPSAVNDPAHRATRTPFADQRHQTIIAHLQAHGSVDAGEIATQLGVTNETVRKDLIALEKQGLLRRVHGGALPAGPLSFEPAVSERVYFMEEKRRIARAALAHLPAEGAVLIDAGSTTGLLAEMFPPGPNLSVYTNALAIALALVKKPNLPVSIFGGRIRPLTVAAVGDWAARALDTINVDVAFLGANGISVDRGMTTPDPDEAAIKHQMLTSARRRIVLADHSKIGTINLCKHADLSEVDLLITDSGISDSHLKALRRTGLEVELA
jgi:DeoR family fructose operon transcriptional repressor